MKTLLTRFADGLLSREQMRKVKGGYTMVHCVCGNGMTVTTGGDVTDQDIDSLCGSKGGPNNCIAVDY